MALYLMAILLYALCDKLNLILQKDRYIPQALHLTVNRPAFIASSVLPRHFFSESAY